MSSNEDDILDADFLQPNTIADQNAYLNAVNNEYADQLQASNIHVHDELLMEGLAADNAAQFPLSGPLGPYHNPNVPMVLPAITTTGVLSVNVPLNPINTPYGLARVSSNVNYNTIQQRPNIPRTSQEIFIDNFRDNFVHSGSSSDSAETRRIRYNNALSSALTANNYQPITPARRTSSTTRTVRSEGEEGAEEARIERERNNKRRRLLISNFSNTPVDSAGMQHQLNTALIASNFSREQRVFATQPDPNEAPNFMLYSIALSNTTPNMNDPMIITIDTTLQNYVYIHNTMSGVSTDISQMLNASFRPAYLMARRNLNLMSAGDEDSNGLENGYYTMENTATPIPVKIFGIHRGVPIARVRVQIANLPVNVNGESTSAIVMQSHNIRISENDTRTIADLFTSVARKYFFGLFEGMLQKGYDDQLTFENLQEDHIRFSYTFMFYKQNNWVAAQDGVPINIGHSEAYMNLNYREPLGDIWNYEPPVDIDHNNFEEIAQNLPAPRRLSSVARIATGVTREPIVTRSVGKSAMKKPSRITTRSMTKSDRAKGNNGRPKNSGKRGNVGSETNNATMYARLKDKIYIKRSLGDFFKYSKACVGVPMTKEQLCFPMAFLRCEKRVWYKNEAGFTKITEGETYKIKLSDDAEPPVNIRNSFFDGEYIYVFDNKKVKIGTHVYQNEAEDLSPDDLELWLWCSWQLHLYVEHIWGSEINFTDLGECLESYSSVFNVNISVFAMEMKGEKIIIEKARNCEEFDSFINLIVQNTHVHAISSIRTYMRSDITGARYSLHGYCDYCNTLCNKRKGKPYTHQNVCVHKDKFNCKSLESMHDDEANCMENRHLYYTLNEKERYGQMCSGCYKEANLCLCIEVKRKIGVQFVSCKMCSEKVPKHYFNTHNCYMKARKAKDRLDNDKLFVYDIESEQDYNEEINQNVHQCILVCLRAIYDDRKWVFHSIADFVIFLIEDEQMWGSTILAHNGKKNHFLFYLFSVFYFYLFFILFL